MDEFFEVSDTCVLQEDVVREFGTIPEGTIVELTNKYRGPLGVHCDADKNRVNRVR